MNRSSWILPVALVFAGSIAVAGQGPPAGRNAQDGAANQPNRMMMGAPQGTDQVLQNLVAEMNAAEGPEKLDAIAKVITQLVAERQAGSSMPMQGAMMQHMAQGTASQQGMMGMGMMMHGDQSGAMMCPMMTMMQPPAEAAPDAAPDARQ